MARLEGKVAFVTGAAGGIGSAICARFLHEGARIAAADIAPSPDVAAGGSDRMLALSCDVGDPTAVQAAIGRTIAAFGGVDVLCNTAGGSTTRDAAVTDAPDDEFWRAIRLDLFGTFLCCKYALPEIIKAGGGSVINMTSVLALMGVPGRDCYTAAKGGVAALTHSVAVEYAPHRIRVNAIAPGVTLTPRVRSRLETSAAVRQLTERHPLGPVDPADVAAMALYLASDDSRSVTGQILAVDGGVTIA